MKTLSKIALTMMIALGLAALAQAQISYTGGIYTQDANSYVGTLATVPAGWAYSFSGTATFNGVGTGTSATGGAWAYGIAGETLSAPSAAARQAMSPWRSISP